MSVDVVFPAGSSQGSQVSFNIPIIDDQLVEGDETILLQASTDEPGEVPSQPPGQDRATVVIRDNDGRKYIRALIKCICSWTENLQ